MRIRSHTIKLTQCNVIIADGFYENVHSLETRLAEIGSQQWYMRTMLLMDGSCNQANLFDGMIRASKLVRRRAGIFTYFVSVPS